MWVAEKRDCKRPTISTIDGLQFHIGRVRELFPMQLASLVQSTNGIINYWIDFIGS